MRMRASTEGMEREGTPGEDAIAWPSEQVKFIWKENSL
jgi:hypothetical protein